MNENQVEAVHPDPAYSPVGWFYLSFAKDGVGFLGAAVVEGANVYEAAKQAHRLGINPGGGVIGVPLDESLLPPEEFRNVLLDKDGVTELDKVLGGAGVIDKVEGPG